MNENVAIGWRIEVRTIEEMERGLIRDDIKDVAYPPKDPRRYTDGGRIKMGIADSADSTRG